MKEFKEMTEAERLAVICCGDAEAMDFVARWAEYCHAGDDIVDSDNLRAEHIIRTSLVLPVLLFTHPFFLRNPAITVSLRQVVLLVANTYADSVAWEHSHAPWQRAHADVLRHAGNEMVFAVAQICGGYDHARMISAEQRTVCYRTQHPENETEEKAA